MARINIEEKWWTDPRRSALTKLVGDEYLADGLAHKVWRVAQGYWSEARSLIPSQVWSTITLGDKLIEVGLAENRDGGIYVKGSEALLTWTYDRKEAGRAGGKTSAQRPRNEQGQLLPKQTPSKTEAESKQKPSKRKQTQASDSGSVSGSGSDSKINTNTPAQPDGFAEFYAGYPRKIGKTVAVKAFKRLLDQGIDPKDIIIARDKYRADCERRGTEEKFVKHPATFLNEHQDWLDPETGTCDLKPAAQVDPWDERAKLVLKAMAACSDQSSKYHDELRSHLGDELYQIVVKIQNGNDRGMRAIRNLRDNEYRLKTIIKLLKAAAASNPNEELNNVVSII